LIGSLSYRSAKKGQGKGKRKRPFIASTSKEYTQHSLSSRGAGWGVGGGGGGGITNNFDAKERKDSCSLLGEKSDRPTGRKETLFSIGAAKAGNSLSPSARKGVPAFVKKKRGILRRTFCRDATSGSIVERGEVLL